MGRKLYVGNLPYTAAEQDLQELFEKVGPVESVTVMRDMATGRARGFGFVRKAVIDQHFVTRKRHNRLISLLAEHPDLLGVAIDESTAVLVRPDEIFEVVGAKQVVIYDPAGAKFRILPNTNIAFTGLLMHALTAGDTFDLKTRKPGTP